MGHGKHRSFLSLPPISGSQRTGGDPGRHSDLLQSRDQQNSLDEPVEDSRRGKVLASGLNMFRRSLSPFGRKSSSSENISDTKVIGVNIAQAAAGCDHSQPSAIASLRTSNDEQRSLSTSGTLSGSTNVNTDPGSSSPTGDTTSTSLIKINQTGAAPHNIESLQIQLYPPRTTADHDGSGGLAIAPSPPPPAGHPSPTPEGPNLLSASKVPQTNSQADTAIPAEVATPDNCPTSTQGSSGAGVPDPQVQPQHALINSTQTDAQPETRLNVGSVPLSQSSTCWKKTLEMANKKLASNNLPLLEIKTSHSQSTSEYIHDIIKTLQEAQEHSKEKRWRFTDWRGKEVVVVEMLGKFFKNVDSYAKIVNAGIQHNPEIAALVWAGCKALMQLTLNHLEAMECFQLTMATILDKMAICEFYANIYADMLNTTNALWLQEAFGSALPGLYAAIVVFLVKARQYLDPATTRYKKAMNIFKPFAVDVQPFLDDISEMEKHIRECGDIATMNRIKQSSEKLIHMERLLQSVRSEMQPLVGLNETLLEIATEQLEVTKSLFKRSFKAEDERIVTLLELLSPLEPLKRHQDVSAVRHEGTGSWLLRLESFRDWRDNKTSDANRRMLCCYGMPGAGKTVISSLVVDHLYTQSLGQSSIGIACFYCDYRDDRNQSVVHIVGSLLHQLLTSGSLSLIPAQIINTLEDIRIRKRRLDTADILSMLKVSLEQFDYAFLCIDALDELEPRIRRELLKVLTNELDKKSVRFWLTGRPHIQSEVNGSFTVGVPYEIDIRANPDDIRRFLTKKIEDDANIYPEAMNKELYEDILCAIAERSQGMFLLPALHIAMILEKTTIAKRRKALQTLPADLYNTFSGVIKRLRKLPNADLTMKVLMWLHLAYRPLKVNELQHALAVESYDIDFDPDNIESERALLNSCGGLVIIDEQTSTIRFVHYSLEEYFQTNSNRYFPNGNSTAAETCLRYISFPKLVTHCASKKELAARCAQYTFLEYASCNWGHHVRHQSNDIVKELAVKLVQCENDCSCCTLQLLYQALIGYASVAKRFSGIHAVAYFGLDEVLRMCSGQGIEWDLTDDVNRTPLSLAAGKGHEVVVQLLLERQNMNADARDKWGETPLSWAARNGHEAVVRLLLERQDVNPSVENIWGMTPLSSATENGHEAVVRLLLERQEVDPDAKDKGGRTPLSSAAENGYESVVRLLVERQEVDPDAKDTWSRTPLLLAAQNGHEAVVRLLLEHQEVDPDAKEEEYGRTPLSWAVQNGHESVVRLLLERQEVDHDVKDIWSTTPLSCAVRKGHEAIVRLLLERQNVDTNTKDNEGRTPLQAAAWGGYEAIVRLLLGRQEVDADAKEDEYGRTPLSWAAENGHETIVRLLLERQEVDPNTKDKYGKTPLLWAAWAGYEAVVRMLLERQEVDPNVKEDEYGRTPLSWAAENGYDDVVGLLLERQEVDPDAKDNQGRTPLSWAASYTRFSGPRYNTVRLLLSRQDVNHHAEDDSGQTPFSRLIATRDEHYRRLLQQTNRMVEGAS